MDDQAHDPEVSVQVVIPREGVERPRGRSELVVWVTGDPERGS